MVEFGGDAEGGGGQYLASTTSSILSIFGPTLATAKLNGKFPPDSIAPPSQRLTPTTRPFSSYATAAIHTCVAALDSEGMDTCPLICALCPVLSICMEVLLIVAGK